MAIPEAVRKQGERSDQLIKAAQQSGETPSPAVTPDITPPAAQQPDEWQQRYNVLKGKYDNEVPDLNRQIQDLRRINDDLTQQITAMKSELEALRQQKTQADESTAAQSLGLEQSSEMLRDQGYSDEMIEAFQGMAKAVHGGEIDSLRKQLSDVTGNLESVQEESVKQSQEAALNAETRFQDEISSKVPDWRVINDSQEFLSWLQEIDEPSGATKLQLLQHAYQQKDLNRTLYFFTQWKAIRSARSDLGPGSQITPSEGGDSETTVGSSQQWAKADITAFYEAVRKGEYRGREQEQERIERDIFRAQSEGRVY